MYEHLNNAEKQKRVVNVGSNPDFSRPQTSHRIADLMCKCFAT
ncbi:hypothetical protein AAZX31_18G093900 [Glycine max]